MSATARPAGGLVRRGSIYTACLALQIGGAFLLVPLVTRSLSVPDYGTVALALVVTKIAAVVAGFGLPAVVTLDAVRTDGERRAAVLIATTTLLALTVGGALHLAAGAVSGALGRPGHPESFAIAGWTAAAMAVQAAGLALLQARDQVFRFALASLTSSVGGQALGVLLIVTGDATADRYLLGLLTGSVASATLAILLARPSLRIGPSELRARDVVRAAASVALPTLPHGVAVYVMGTGDRVVLSHLGSATEVGTYDVGYSIGVLSLALLVGFNQAWATAIYRAPDEDRWFMLAETTKTVRYVAATVAAVATILAPLAVLLAAPSTYPRDEIRQVATILPVAVVPYVEYLSGVHVLFTMRRTGPLAVTTIAAAATSLAACAVLYVPFGIRGAAAATVVGYACHAFAVRRFADRLASVSWARGSTAAALSVVAGAAALSLVAPDSGPWLGVRISAAVLVLGLAGMKVSKRQRGRVGGAGA